MHIILLIITLLCLSGCSTVYKPCKCNCQKSTQKETIYKAVESKVAVYTPKNKATESSVVYYNKRVNYVRQKAKPYWGNKAKVASKYEYVKYAKDFKARSSINFENGIIRVETTATSNPKQVLKEVIANTLLNTQNPENVDQFSTRHSVQVGEPFLYNRITDHDGKKIRWPWRAKRYAQHLVDTKLYKDRITTTQGSKQRYYVKINMKNEKFSHTSSYSSNSTNSGQYYSSIVNTQAKRFDINPALIFALIETESHFNPLATSAIPAYGLMQVVPRSAGRDAWKFLTKHKGQPSRNYLFNPKNNIEMGSAYVHILLNRYLSKIKNIKTREYCAIAAYNTGSGNVLKSFHKSRKLAFNKINSLSPEAVYKHLRAKLPYKETRDYIQKVTKAKKRYL